MAASYATIEDVYLMGVPRGALISPARIVASVDVSSNRIEVEGHGLGVDAAIQFVADQGGVLPAPLAALTIYYAIPVAASDSMLQVAASVGGPAIDLTTAGTSPFRLHVPIGPSIEQELEAHSRWADTLLPAHQVPLEPPFPAWIVSVVAKRTAASMVRRLRRGDCQSILDEAADVTRDVLRMAKSAQPLRDAAATAPSNLATGSSPTFSSRWGRIDRTRIP